jgi:nicotinate-nucleotide adenylyltransferase
MYGGTFDPIHNAHLVVAEYAQSELPLDLLLFVPSYIPPHKLSKKISSPEHRLNMLNLVVHENPKFDVCTFELEKGGTSFTIDTLHYLQELYTVSRDDLFIVICADNLVDFHRWKAPDAILQAARIVVAGRPAYETSNPIYDDFIFLNSPLLDISASMIRERVRENKSVKYLLPDAVDDYIQSHKLYK